MLKSPISGFIYIHFSTSGSNRYTAPFAIFPGGLLIGCNAGTLNSAKIKGSHTAMKSGILAGEILFEAVSNNPSEKELTEFSLRFENSELKEELYKTRNFSAGFHKFGFWLGSALAFIEQNIFFGKSPFTFHDKSKDHCQLNPA